MVHKDFTNNLKIVKLWSLLLYHLVHMQIHSDLDTNKCDSTHALKQNIVEKQSRLQALG
jgi:hypothetical protein